MWPKSNLRAGVIAISAPIFGSTPRIAQRCIGEGETTSARCCTKPTRHDEYSVPIHGLTDPHSVDRTWKPPRWKPPRILVHRGGTRRPHSVETNVTRPKSTRPFTYSLTSKLSMSLDRSGTACVQAPI